MPRIRIWDLLLGAALLAMFAHMILLVRQRSALETAGDGRIMEKPAGPSSRDEDIDRLAALRQDRNALATSLAQLQSRFDLVEAEKTTLDLRVTLLESQLARGGDNEAIQGVLNELDASNDRLRKAYQDIAEMEKQLVDVSRSKNDIEQLLSELEGGTRPPPYEVEPKIDGIVLGVSDKTNLVLISVGGSDKVMVGYKFTVYRGSEYVSKLVVDKVEEGWAACRELTAFRKSAIEQGDNVSTRVFD